MLSSDKAISLFSHYIVNEGEIRSFYLLSCLGCCSHNVSAVELSDLFQVSFVVIGKLEGFPTEPFLQSGLILLRSLS